MTARAGRALDAQLITSSLSDIERAAEAIQAVLDEPEELVSPEPQQLEIAVKALMEAHRALKATGLIESEPVTFALRDDDCVFGCENTDGPCPGDVA